MVKALYTLRSCSHWLFALVLVLAAGRFAFVAAAPLIERADAALVPVLPVDTAEDTTEAASSKPPARDPSQRPGASERGESAAKGDAVAVMLSVSDSRGRSKVYLNDAFVGHTTFMTNFSCQRGELLSVRIVPPNGKVIERKATCGSPALSFSN